MIDLVNISIQFGGNFLFKDVNLKFNKGDKIALVGANGTGKSTLLKLITGIEQSETGNILFQKGTRVGYLGQEFSQLKGKTLFNEVKSALAIYAELDNEADKINSSLTACHLSEEEKLKLIAHLGEINNIKEQINYYSLDSRIEKVLMGLGFQISDFTKYTDEFSGGWQMRIELSKILLSENDIILLDEPTNHLDIDTLQWVIDFLIEFRGAVLLVSHDKFFVNKVSNKTLEIFNKSLAFFNGKLDAFEKYKAERDQQLEAQYIQQQKIIKDTERFIDRFRYKSTKAKQVQSRVKQLEKIDLIELVNQEKEIEIKFPEPPRCGSMPVEIQELSKNYDSNQVLKNINFQLERGDKVAFVGPNGAGKTTLAKIIAGIANPTSGKITLGHNVSISYYAQEVAENLNTELDILESVMSISPDLTPGRLRSLLGSFLFTGADVFKKVKVLSGGEKSRVALAKILLTQANLIILDEPTNHLDFSSKKVLQNALVNYSGTLIIVSHDVEFLEPIINKVLEVRNHKVQFFHGGIDYYLLKKTEIQVIEDDNKDASAISNNRKDQKRIEAEYRRERYKVTKDIKQQIETIENKIAELEQTKLILENELADSEIFSNPTLAKKKNADYEKVKVDLEHEFSVWTDSSEKLEIIEINLEKKYL